VGGVECERLVQRSLGLGDIAKPRLNQSQLGPAVCEVWRQLQRRRDLTQSRIQVVLLPRNPAEKVMRADGGFGTCDRGGEPQ